MSSLTKVELLQSNARLSAENDRLRHQVAQLQQDFLRVTEVASSLNTVSTLSARQQAMRVARELAMTSGRCVKAL